MASFAPDPARARPFSTPGALGVEIGDLGERYAASFAGFAADAVMMRPDLYLYADVTGRDAFAAPLEQMDPAACEATG